jgi:putative urate catabolism protein
MVDMMRDIVGYGGKPPHPQWPNNARLAVNFVLNYEEGSEYNVADDGVSESILSEVSFPNYPEGVRDLAIESVYEYGSRAGFWRIIDTFAARGVPLTVYGCALALERNPPAAEAIAAAGFDVCCHGYRWIEHFKLGVEQEREQIQLAISSLQRTFGERPLGWYCRYGPSVNTRQLLVEEGGFLYDSDSYNDDLPYWTIVSGKPHLVVPYCLDTNDARFTVPAGFAGSNDFFTYCKDAFDTLYYEGERLPKMLSIGMHCRILGRPARVAGLARFIDYLKSHEAVWVCRRLDIARHWIEHHPFEPVPREG